MEPINIREGATVYDANGDKLGKVVALQGSDLIVEKGFFFPTDYIVPSSLVTSATDDEIHLSVTKDQAVDSSRSIDDVDRTVAPTTTDSMSEPLTSAPRGDVAYADDLATGDGTHDNRAAAAEVTGTIGADFDAAGGDVAQTSDEVLRVPVHEEELTATKRPVVQGKVRISKEIVAEDRALDVPVAEERVHVTRRAVDRASTDADAFDEGTIEVPLTGEAVDVQKRVRVAEEVEVGKERVQRTERVADTVRREEVRIEDQTVGADQGIPS